MSWVVKGGEEREGEQREGRGGEGRGEKEKTDTYIFGISTSQALRCFSLILRHLIIKTASLSRIITLSLQTETAKL